MFQQIYWWSISYWNVPCQYSGIFYFFSRDYICFSFVGLSVLGIANDQQYDITCCGFVKQWLFYAKANPGTLNLQIWRPGTSPSYSLQGENIVTVSCMYMKIIMSEWVFHWLNTSKYRIIVRASYLFMRW